MRRFLSASSLALTFIPIAMLAFTIALVSTSSTVVAQEADDVIVLEIPPLPGDEPDEPTAEPTSTTGEVFSDRAEFEAEVCGVLVQESLPVAEQGLLVDLLDGTIGSSVELSLVGFSSPQRLSVSTLSTTLTNPFPLGGFGFFGIENQLDGLGIVGLIAPSLKGGVPALDDSEMEAPVGIEPPTDGGLELIEFPGFVENPEETEVSVPDLDFLLINALPGPDGEIVDGDLSFSPETPDGSFLEGFCFDYIGEGVITIFDGDEVVDTINPVAATTNFGSDPITICWLNTDQLNVTRIEVTTGLSGFAICRADFAFKEIEDTCRSLLQDLIEDVVMIAPGEGQYDEYLLNCAIAFLGCADHDSLWIDDNQVVDCDIFYFLFKATKCLGFVSDSPEVDLALADIQEVLSCITDNEIAAATAADGSSSLIECAAYLQSSADDFQSIGFFRKATVLRKLAWLKAAYAY